MSLSPGTNRQKNADSAGRFDLALSVCSLQND